MVNDLVTPKLIATEMLPALLESETITRLLTRDFQTALLQRSKGQTVEFRVPGTFVAKDFNHTDGIEIQTMTETTRELRLDNITDVSFEVTDTEATFEVDSLTRQFFLPAATALSRGITLAALKELQDLAGREVGAGSNTTTRPYSIKTSRVLIEAGKVLDDALAPPSQRYALIGGNMKADWVGEDIVLHADKSGSTAALRQASVGQQLFDFDVYKTTDIKTPAGTPAPGAPTTEVGVAFHQGALAFASGKLAMADGAESYVIARDGLSLRVIKQYDIHHKKSIFSVDVLWGMNALRPEHIVALKGADAA